MQSRWIPSGTATRCSFDKRLRVLLFNAVWRLTHLFVCIDRLLNRVMDTLGWREQQASLGRTHSDLDLNPDRVLSF